MASGSISISGRHHDSLIARKALNKTNFIFIVYFSRYDEVMQIHGREYADEK